MAGTRVEGLAETYSLFDRFPEAVREQVGGGLAKIGEDIRAAQSRSVAKLTGKLASGLSLDLQIEELRVSVGLIGAPARRNLFYGRIVERGRRAQTVLVQRRRRVKGRLRTQSRRKLASDIAATYSMNVRAMAPRPFVYVDRPEIRAEQRLASLLSDALSRSGR